MLDLIEGIEASVDVVDGESDEVFGLGEEGEESGGSLLRDGVRVRSKGRGGGSKTSLWGQNGKERVRWTKAGEERGGRRRDER